MLNLTTNHTQQRCHISGQDNIDDDINSILMTVFNEVDKVNKREMSVRLRE